MHWLTVKTRIQEHPFSGFRLIGFSYIAYFRWNQPESVLNFLLLKKCKGFINYDEIHNFEKKLNLRHTTLENKLYNQAFDWHPKKEKGRISIFKNNFKFSGWMCSYICSSFLPNFGLGVLNPHVFGCRFLPYMYLFRPRTHCMVWNYPLISIEKRLACALKCKSMCTCPWLSRWYNEMRNRMKARPTKDLHYSWFENFFILYLPKSLCNFSLY